MPSATDQAANKPELKIGPFPGGISVNVWLNTVQTDQGTRKLRSVTIAPQELPGRKRRMAAVRLIQTNRLAGHGPGIAEGVRILRHYAASRCCPDR